MNGGSGGGRAGPMPNLKTMQMDALTHECGRKGCFRGSAAPDCEFHGNIVRDIIRMRRDQRRARLQQRSRSHSDAMPTTATASASTSRNVTPLKRQSSQSSKLDSPNSCTSSEFSSDISPCVSPLMEDLMLEVEDAIDDSNGMRPELTGSPKRKTSAFNMDEIFKLIDEAQKEYESLSASPSTARGRNDFARGARWVREDSWETLLGPR
ncbi:hypothetical protein EsH8_II_000792 [Colletotrichum jinshuiense]